MLIRLGAALIRDANDVRELLGLKRTDKNPTLINIDELSDEEKVFIKILERPHSRDELIRKSKLEVSTASPTLGNATSWPWRTKHTSNISLNDISLNVSNEFDNKSVLPVQLFLDRLQFISELSFARRNFFQSLFCSEEPRL